MQSLLPYLIVLSRLDYCNSLLAGLPHCMIKRLQHVQNCTARLILKAPKLEHTSTLLQQLHWLPIPACILYKHNHLAFSPINFDAPSCLSDILHHHCPSGYLCSSEDTLIPTVPKFNCKVKGDHSFSYFAAKNHGTLP